MADEFSGGSSVLGDERGMMSEVNVTFVLK
jgi:hypothetical protein